MGLSSGNTNFCKATCLAARPRTACLICSSFITCHPNILTFPPHWVLPQVFLFQPNKKHEPWKVRPQNSPPTIHHKSNPKLSPHRASIDRLEAIIIGEKFQIRHTPRSLCDTSQLSRTCLEIFHQGKFQGERNPVGEKKIDAIILLTRSLLVGGFQPIWKIKLVKSDHFPRLGGENKQIFETTTQSRNRSQGEKKNEVVSLKEEGAIFFWNQPFGVGKLESWVAVIGESKLGYSYRIGESNGGKLGAR